VSRAATLVRTIGDHLLDKFAPKAEAKAGGCYRQRYCYGRQGGWQTCCEAPGGRVRCGALYGPNPCY
jgi:hypothetical protein